MKILTNVKFYLVIAVIAFLSTLIHYLNQKDELKKTKEELIKCQVDGNYVPGGNIQQAEEQSVIDSLNTELFNKSTEVGRYEITLEYLKEVNPKAYEQFEKYLQTQTE